MLAKSSLLCAAALFATAQATIKVVWQAGTCKDRTGTTLDLSPEGVNACTLYNFFPNGDPRGSLQVTIENTSNGLAVFQLPPSQENQHIQCGSLMGVFHQSGCYDSVVSALDVVTAECDQTGCNNLVGIPSGSVVSDMASLNAAVKREETAFKARQAARAAKEAAAIEEAAAQDALVKRGGCSGSTSVTCDDCVNCFAQGARVSPFISCPGQGESCAVQLTHSITVTDSFSMSVGAADIFTASVEVSHSIAVTNGDSETFTVSPGQAGFVQYQALAQCGTKTVHNGDGSVCAQAKGTFVLDNQGAGGQLAFVRSN